MNLFKLLTVLALVALSSGCAAVSVRGSHAAVTGTTVRTIAAVNAAAQADVAMTNAETYQTAVESGYAYPYAGGGYGNDYLLYYGGVIPTQPQAAPASAQPAPAPASDDPSAPATQEQLAAVLSVADAANEKADDGLRMHRKLCEREGNCPAQPQPATK